MVPCTITAPARTAASVFATPQPASSWVWMPIRVATGPATSATIDSTSHGIAPPLVSHSTRKSAPPAAAAAGCRARTPGSPSSRRRSARRRTPAPCRRASGSARCPRSSPGSRAAWSRSPRARGGPSLAHQRDHRRLRREQQLDVGVVVAVGLLVARRAEAQILAWSAGPRGCGEELTSLGLDPGQPPSM